MHPTAGGAFRSPLAGPPFNLGDTHIRWTRGGAPVPPSWRAIASELPGGESKSGGLHPADDSQKDVTDLQSWKASRAGAALPLRHRASSLKLMPRS